MTRPFLLFALLLPLLACAEEKPDYVPQPGQFPPPNTGHYLAGDLVTIDPANRRGSLRPDGNGKDDWAPLHSFAMLPYGMLWYNGAPAELRDIPVGTHLHGYFFVPPVDEEATIPPLPPATRSRRSNTITRSPWRTTSASISAAGSRGRWSHSTRPKAN